MDTQRTKYPKLLLDPKAGLIFQKRTKVNVPQDYYRLQWADLHSLRSNCLKGVESVLAIAEKENRDLNDEEKLAFDLGTQAIDAINEEFSLREARGTKEAFDNTGPNEPVQRAPVSYSHNVEKTTGPAVRKDFRSMFRPNQSGLDKAGFNSFDDFLNSLTNRLKDERMDRRAFMVKDAPSGGYAVPEFWAGDIFDQGLEGEIVRPRAVVYPMDSEILHVPAWDNMNHTNGSVYGGFTISYLGENQDATPVTGSLRSVTLTSHKIGIYTEISREAISSGISLEAQLKAKLVSAVSFLLDRDFLTGSGIARPQGVLNDSSRINVARATANQVNYADIIGMYGRLAPQCQQRAIWVASHSVLPQLLNMTVASELVFVNGIATSAPLTLFGRPILFTEKTSALGTAGDLMLVDLSHYAIGMRQEIVLDISNAPGWTRDVVSLRAIVRVDGVGLWKDPITPVNGGDTLSWCVVLQ